MFCFNLLLILFLLLPDLSPIVQPFAPNIFKMSKNMKQKNCTAEGLSTFDGANILNQFSHKQLIQQLIQRNVNCLKFNNKTKSSLNPYPWIQGLT